MSSNKEKDLIKEEAVTEKHASSKDQGEKHLAAENVEEKKKGSWTGRIIILVLFLVALGIYFAVPSVHEWVNKVLVMFRTGNFDDMHAFIAQYGKWAMAISFLLMVFQSIAAPLPAFFITLTNANLFGWWQGCILSWVSSMTGAAMCFWIARILGRDVVEKICTKGALLSIEEFFAKYGKRCILVARLLPFISFDIVSYAAGLTAMDFWGFFLATGVGQLPACIVYSYVGGMLTGGAKKMFIGLMCLFALAIVVILIKQVYNASQKKKEEAAKAAGEVYFKDPSNPARLFSKFYNSAIWSMVITLVLSGIPKITGAVNIGWIYLGLCLGLFALTALFRKFKCKPVFTLISTVISLAAIYLLCGSPAALGRKPAGIVRMGLGLRTVSMNTFNIIFAAFIVVGFIIIVLLWKRQKGIDAAAKEEYERLKAEAEANKETVTA
ncbi:MAG: TVP38/TMEM64 family protein [Mogibacterium sp.]|nr:TVP38/TMEM64 family protein [Mogibacterium sp.]